jgi:hypothetical protein
LIVVAVVVVAVAVVVVVVVVVVVFLSEQWYLAAIDAETLTATERRENDGDEIDFDVGVENRDGSGRLQAGDFDGVSFHPIVTEEDIPDGQTTPFQP